MLGLDNHSGPEPALDDVDLVRVARALATPGVRAADLATAYGVTVRSIYRYRGAKIEYHVIGGKRVAFLLRPNQAPVGVTVRRRRRVPVGQVCRCA